MTDEKATLTLSQEKVAHTIDVSNRAKMLAAFWFALSAALIDRPVTIVHSDGRKWQIVRTEEARDASNDQHSDVSC